MTGKRRFQIALHHELDSVSPLRRASLAPTTFKDYINNVRRFLRYVQNFELPTSTEIDLDRALADYGLVLYDDNPKRGQLQTFRYALFGIIFLLPELKQCLGRARQLERGWDKTVPSRSPLLSPSVPFNLSVPGSLPLVKFALRLQ